MQADDEVTLITAQTKHFNYSSSRRRRALSDMKPWQCKSVCKIVSHIFHMEAVSKWDTSTKGRFRNNKHLSLSGKSYFLSRSLCDLLLQELVDVYVEYPFFVRGCGWSSCSPERTALLCGLQCRQLSVGDVCLALTPVAAPPMRSQNEEGKSKSVQGQEPPVDLGLEEPFGGRKRTTRKRHQSAP